MRGISRKSAVAAVLLEADRPLELRELSLPELKPGQVLVEMAYSGVCQSQLLEVRGKRGPDRFLPHTLGHEGSGTVVKVGPGVTKVKPGDHVVLSWIKGSGADVGSTVYGSQKGPVNSGAISTFMHLTITCENRVTPIDKAMPLREAALLGCAIPTGAGAVLNTAKVTPGSTVAIFGMGGIGLSAIMAARLMHATTIVAVDVLDYKLTQARQLGATHLVNATSEDPRKVISELTHQRGVDFAIEAAGHSETMEAAFKVTRDKGGLCILAGNLPYGGQISLDPFDFIKGKRLVGTWGGETNPDKDIPYYVDLYRCGKLRLDSLVTHTYTIDQINNALDDLEHQRVGRALIDMYCPT